MRFYRKIVGERLYLSPLDTADAELQAKWVEWMNDHAVAEYYGGNPSLVTPASAKDTLEGLKGYRFAIVLLECDEFIGQISLHDVDHLNRNAFIGIFIGDAVNRNIGYGAEAIRLALRYGFLTLNLNNIMLSVAADNVAAIACYKKIGFREAGRRREWVFKDGKYVDRVYMDMLAREFSK